MKKLFVFLALALLLLSFFACDLQMPREILITGTPQLKFSASTDFNDMFSSIVRDGFVSDNEDFEVVDCINTNINTFILYKPIFEIDLDVDSLSLSGGNYIVPAITLLEVGQTTLELEGLAESLEGFNFKQVQSRLFISGSEIVESLSVNLSFENYDKLLDSLDPQGSSDFNKDEWSKFTSMQSLPPTDHNIDLTAHVNNHQDLIFNYEIFINQGNYSQVWLQESGKKIKAELVIWLEMDFEAAQDNAEIFFPEDFFKGVGSFITSVAEVEAVERLIMEIHMTQNPFKEGELVMKNAGMNDIINPLGDKSLIFNIENQSLEEIVNLGKSFEPAFSIRFDMGDELIIPRVLNTTTISLKVGIHHLEKL